MARPPPQRWQGECPPLWIGGGRVCRALRHSEERLELTQRDALLITYADQVREPGEPPLRTLADFCARHLQRRRQRRPPPAVLSRGPPTTASR